MGRMTSVAPYQTSAHLEQMPFSEFEDRVLQALDDNEDLLVTWAPQIQEYYTDGYTPQEASVMVEDLEYGCLEIGMGTVGTDYDYAASLP